MKRLEEVQRMISHQAVLWSRRLTEKGFGFVGTVDDLKNDGWLAYYTYLREIEEKTGEKSIDYITGFVKKFMKKEMLKYAGVRISTYKFWQIMQGEGNDDVKILYIEDLDDIDNYEEY